MLMQIWECTSCKSNRSWGNGPYDKEQYRDYHPKLTCENCAGPTPHRFKELNLDAYIHTYNSALAMLR